MCVESQPLSRSARRRAAFDQENATFSWHDYKQNYAAKTTTLAARELLRRFAMHIARRVSSAFATSAAALKAAVRPAGMPAGRS